MDTVERFSDFLRQIGAHNYLAIGIVVIIIWLLISGFRKGLKKKGRSDKPENDDEKQDKDLSD